MPSGPILTCQGIAVWRVPCRARGICRGTRLYPMSCRHICGQRWCDRVHELLVRSLFLGRRIDVLNVLSWDVWQHYRGV